jgi:hypothetical protein
MWRAGSAGGGGGGGEIEGALHYGDGGLEISFPGGRLGATDF